MIDIGLVDDRTYDLEKLQTILQQESDITISFATTDPEEALRLVTSSNIDILITDIEMPKLSGYELADIVHSHGLDIHIIFVTGYSVYAVHAFELDVLDYILKPYSKERLLKGIDRYKHRQEVIKASDRLLLKHKSNIHVIEKQQIIFIERTGRSTTIVTTTGEYITYQPLVDLEKELPRKNFIRSHRGFIINLKYVKNFTLYTSQSYAVQFHETTQTAMITKANMENVQKEMF